YKVVEANVSVYQTHIHTDFIFNNHKRLSTQLKSVNEMSINERKAIQNLFEDNFEMINEDDEELAIKHKFMNDFSGNKFIDIIYDNEKVIGFNLFESVKLPDP